MRVEGATVLGHGPNASLAVRLPAAYRAAAREAALVFGIPAAHFPSPSRLCPAAPPRGAPDATAARARASRRSMAGSSGSLAAGSCGMYLDGGRRVKSVRQDDPMVRVSSCTVACSEAAQDPHFPVSILLAVMHMPTVSLEQRSTKVSPR